MGPLTSFLLSQLSEESVGPLQSKLAEKTLTPADVNRLAEDLVAEWQTDPELKARSLALIGKKPKDSISHRDLEMMVRLLHATHSKDASVEYHGKTFPGYNKPISSDKKEKKMMVLAKKGNQVKLVHFGQKGYQHNYSPEAKQNYLTRSAGIRNKSGELTKDDPFSPNYWARKVLWPKGETGHGHNGPVNTEVRMQRKEAGLFAEDKFVDSPFGKIHDMDHSYAVDYLPLHTDDPHITRDAIIKGLSAAAKPTFTPGGFFEERRKKNYEQDLASWKRTRNPDYLRRLAMDVAHNGDPSVFGVRTEKKASLFDVIAARKENEKWAAAAKLAEDDNFGHGAELAGLGILAVPTAASVIGKKFKVPSLRRFGERGAVKHTTELVGLGTLAAPSVLHFMKKKPANPGQ